MRVVVEDGAARAHNGDVRMALIVSAIAVLSLATSCVAPQRVPVAVVRPVRVAAPPPPAAPAVLPTDWRDWPQTPGDWRYSGGPYGSIAEFAQSGARVFNLGCDRHSRQVTLTSEQAIGAPTMTVRTTSLTRTIAVVVGGHPPRGGSAPLAANDPLLDAMGFSRGRFVVEQVGAAPLVLPAWAEVERVVEDCRG